MATFPRGHWTAKVTRHNQHITQKLKRDRPPPTPDLRNLDDTNTRDLIVMQLIKRDGDRCYLCQQPHHPSTYEIEHIIPKAHGGTDDLHNLALACKPSNSRKNDRIISMRIEDHMPCYWIPR